MNKNRVTVYQIDLEKWKELERRTKREERIFKILLPFMLPILLPLAYFRYRWKFRKGGG